MFDRDFKYASYVRSGYALPIFYVPILLLFMYSRIFMLPLNKSSLS